MQTKQTFLQTVSNKLKLNENYDIIIYRKL